MNLMDKILNTARIMWSISFIVGVVIYLIGYLGDKDILLKASMYFIFGLIGLMGAALGLWWLTGIWMNLQEMWG